MTNRRFESIGSILSRPAAVPPPATEETEEPELDTTTRLRAVPATADGDRPAPPVGDRQKSPGRARPHEQPSPPRRTTPPPTKASAAAAGGPRRVVFRLDPDLHARLSAHAATAGISYGEVVLDAVEDAYRRGALDELLQQPDPLASGMFPRLRTRNAARATIPVEIRLDGRAVDHLDTLASERHAASRTHLMTVAIEAFLGHPGGAGTN